MSVFRVRLLKHQQQQAPASELRNNSSRRAGCGGRPKLSESAGRAQRAAEVIRVGGLGAADRARTEACEPGTADRVRTEAGEPGGAGGGLGAAAGSDSSRRARTEAGEAGIKYTLKI